jgi:hypothetical protein
MNAVEGSSQKGIRETQKGINRTQKGYVAPSLRAYGSLKTLTEGFKPAKKEKAPSR